MVIEQWLSPAWNWASIILSLWHACLGATVSATPRCVVWVDSCIGPVTPMLQSHMVQANLSAITGSSYAGRPEVKWPANLHGFRALTTEGWYLDNTAVNDWAPQYLSEPLTNKSCTYSATNYTEKGPGTGGPAASMPLTGTGGNCTCTCTEGQSICQVMACPLPPFSK